MRNRQFVWIGMALLIASAGFAETILTAQDYAVDSDVVLESAVREIKSIPRDTVNVIGDGIKYVKDEAVTAVDGVKAVFKDDPHADAQLAGELAVEDAWDTSDHVEFRSYKVSDEIGDALMSAAGEEIGQSVNVSGFFKTVEFPEKTSAFYLPKLTTLLVKHTPNGILGVESELADYHSARRELMGHQVEIETKLVEVNQNTLNELGFSWRFENKDGDGLRLLNNLYLPAGQDLLATGLRTAASAIGAEHSPGVLEVTKGTGSLQWNLFISALEQSDDADVLSAPRVVTRDGNTAVIKIGERRMMPQSFDVNHASISPWVEHSDWNSTLIGVELEVTPEIREGGLIDLDIAPKVKDILGYDSYQAIPAYSIGASGSGSSSSSAREVENPIIGTVPYFRVREISTRVTVADGSTIGMGGLIYDKLETYRDKVPVLGSLPLLGRLFRSEGERSVKRNLMIFVTATQVDVNGQKASDLALKH